MTTIKLNRVWKLGPVLASGGFGRVHEAEADDGSAAVVKLIPKDPGAQRELLFEDISNGDNIIPILDTGEWQDNWVLVMPRADKSLRQHMADSGGQLTLEQTMPVLVDIAEALASIAGDVVHRDLKPENVLLYEGHWCLADFGIARYAGATTELETRKFAMTAPYAAPEQWRGERATSAADVYAFGVIAFELTQGQRPFAGPDFREQHLNTTPPPPKGLTAPLSSVITECLVKAPAARPTAPSILSRLRAFGNPSSAAATKLQEANNAINLKRSEEAAIKSAEKSRLEERGQLLEAAQRSFEEVVEALGRAVMDSASAAQVKATGTSTVFRLGDGALIIDTVQSAPADCLAAFNYEPTFDVVAYSAIAARKDRDRYGYAGRAHSLWFCDAHEEGVYRWYELAFMIMPGISERNELDPFALPPTEELAAVCFTPVTDIRQLAWKPVPFDQGDEGQFIERWLTWLAEAASGNLKHPSHMPEESGGHHRSARTRSRA